MSSGGAISNNLLWASTGGGWRAMFACSGYANVFQQAGLLGPSESKFRAVSTVSGGSWFSTQLFYSPEFYNRTAMASSPVELNDFVLEWMDTYLQISTEITPDIKQTCDFRDLYNGENGEFVNTLTEFCYLLVKYDFDWALFIQAMLQAASEGYGHGEFVNVTASAANIVAPLRGRTDLLVQAALVPASRVRDGTSSGTAVYLGWDGEESENAAPDARLWTVALSAAWIVDALTNSAEFAYGINERVESADATQTTIQTYVAPTPHAHSWSDWTDFYLYKGAGTTFGHANISNAGAGINAKSNGPFRAPFGGTTPTVVQVASISSAAAGNGSPLAPVSYTQSLSIGRYTIEVNRTETVWRVLAGIAAGLGAGVFLGVAVSWAAFRWNWCGSRDDDPRTTGDGDGDGGEDDKKDVAEGGVGGDAAEEGGSAAGDDTDDVAKSGDSGRVEEGEGAEEVASAAAAESEPAKPEAAKEEGATDAEQLRKESPAPEEAAAADDAAEASAKAEAADDEAPPVHGSKDNDDKDSGSGDGNVKKKNNCCCCRCERPARNWGIGCGVFFAVVAGVFTGVYYGRGSTIVPIAYDRTVDGIYQNTSFDNFAVCSQWPELPCRERDGYMIDGWLVDNPALAINIGHTQKKTARNETIKVLLTNCNEVWDTEWTRAQYLAYFSTYFNERVAPGEYLWGPGWFVPSRSQQIFAEYLDPAGLDALLVPVPGTDLTTALLSGTTVDNPAYNVRAGQKVEMLLINTNSGIPTNVIGETALLEWTVPLADMASAIAGSEELVARVSEFVREG